jgi:excisionase family DNA binding protein
MLTAKAVAQQLGISQKAVYDLAAARLLACYRLGVGGGAVRFAQADVDAYAYAANHAADSQTNVYYPGYTATDHHNWMVGVLVEELQKAKP